MSKPIYIFSIIVLFVVIFYLAKELYYYFNFKEGIGMFGMVQNEQKIVAANAQQATMVQGAPSGYAAETSTVASKSSAPDPSVAAVTAVNEYQVSTNEYKYDAFKKGYNDISNNVNVQFHDDYLDEKDDYGNPAGTSYITDKKGNVTAIPPTGLGVKPTYYNPKDYVYGSLTYVPNYEDSVYLSRTANMFIGQPTVETSSIQGGVCNYYKNNPDQLEQACQHMDPNVCASTSCCVLLGGAKCVSGSQNGPKMKSHYSNIMIPNRDFYYYQSKCYGNCPRQ
jgi:hypothetical protein